MLFLPTQRMQSGVSAVLGRVEVADIGLSPDNGLMLMTTKIKEAKGDAHDNKQEHRIQRSKQDG
jgi:hypothetical protein